MFIVAGLFHARLPRGHVTNKAPSGLEVFSRRSPLFTARLKDFCHSSNPLCSLYANWSGWMKPGVGASNWGEQSKDRAGPSSLQRNFSSAFLSSVSLSGKSEACSPFHRTPFQLATPAWASSLWLTTSRRSCAGLSTGTKGRSPRLKSFIAMST